MGSTVVMSAIRYCQWQYVKMSVVTTARTPAMTTTSYALLGLLSIRPWSTYELAKQVERGLGWFWPRTERKIYDEAKRLVASGHARATKERSGDRPRTVYRITAKGRRALRAWLDEASAPPKLETEAMVRVFFADAGDLDQLRATLTRTAVEAEERLTILRAMIAAQEDPDYPFTERAHVNALAMRFQLDHHRLVADWARWAIKQTRSWSSTTDPAGWDWRPALAERPRRHPGR